MIRTISQRCRGAGGVVTGATTAYRSRAPSRLPKARRPSARASRLAKADAVLVRVPTPLTRNREPDLGRSTRWESPTQCGCSRPRTSRLTIHPGPRRPPRSGQEHRLIGPPRTECGPVGRLQRGLALPHPTRPRAPDVVRPVAKSHHSRSSCPPPSCQSRTRSATPPARGVPPLLDCTMSKPGQSSPAYGTLSAETDR